MLTLSDKIGSVVIEWHNNDNSDSVFDFVD